MNKPEPPRDDAAVTSQPPEPVTIADVIPFAFNAGVYRAWAELCEPQAARNLRSKTLEAYRSRWSEAPVYGTLEADEAFFIKTMDEQYNNQKHGRSRASS